MTAPALDKDFLSIQSALAGQYSLERELGRGGMGIVYLAREVALDRPVAIKVLPPELGAVPELRERFVREAQTAARLSHPNIVPIFRVGEAGAYVFFAMAFIDGETLTQRVRARGPLNEREGVRILREVAWALAYAHARGIVHRDVKPDNIMLERETGRALVTDFGIAHLSQASALTSAGLVMGTAHYMSPEQAAGEAIDGRSDLYALGIVAHFALTGRLPFDAPTTPALLALHLTKPAPPLSSIAHNVSRTLAHAVDTCLAKDPAQRYPSGEALADALAEPARPASELPIALRLWVTRRDPMRAVYVAWSGFFGFITMIGLGATILMHGKVSGILALVALTAAPIIPFTAAVISRVRRLFAAGFNLDDLRLGLRQQMEIEREEMEFELQEGPSLMGRAVRWLTLLGVAVIAAITIVGYVSPGAISLQAAANTIFLTSLITIGLAAVGRNFPGRAVETVAPSKTRLKFWSSKVGEFIGRIAQLGLKKTSAPAIPAHRPTEMAIGLAAGQLYESLPAATQQKLGDLPAVLKQLESSAQRMRQRVAELDSAIQRLSMTEGAPRSTAMAEFGSATADKVRAREADVSADLRAAREAAGRRLADSVAALENIRLDLLRLQVGAGSVSALTDAIEAARRIGGDIDILVDARKETDAALSSSPPPTSPPAGIAI